ncbi:phage primase [Vairimorpha apis BRL 01]|uniref:Phage primase n=1 Tax=Vairimorpha apis BRL 01 TaxID=1037528 RepID=T0KYD1_9MICR|nr:phage primase [Vairimorpha apis BRL 01]
MNVMVDRTRFPKRLASNTHVSEANVNPIGLTPILTYNCIKTLYSTEAYRLLKHFLRFQSLQDLCDIFMSSKEANLIKFSEGLIYTNENYLWKVEKTAKIVRALIAKAFKEFFDPLFVAVNSNSDLYVFRTYATALLRRLECNSTLSYIENTCILKLKDDLFTSKLDSNLKILPFLNGYVDLNDKKFYNYDGTQLISMTLPYEFEYTDNSEDIDQIMNLLFLNSEEREFMFRLMATFLDNTLPNDKLIILKGSGSNGKSLLLRLLSLVFGQFSTSLVSNFFTYDDNTVGGANPVLRDLKFQKIAFLSEPNGKRMRTEIVKRLCGNDEITARSLYSNDIVRFKLRTKFIIALNALPSFKSVDDEF